MRAAPKTNPLQAAVVIGGSSYPETAYSLLEVASRDVIVWAVKPAEEGIDRGVVLRIWNQAHRPMATEVRFSSPPVTAMQTTHIETDLREARLNGSALPVILQTQQLQTFRLQFERPAQR